MADQDLWGEAQRLTTALGTSRSLLSAVSAIVVDRIADKGKAWRFLRCRSTRDGLTCIALSPVLVGARRRVCAGLQYVARSPRHTVVRPSCRVQSFSRPFQSRGLRSGGTPRTVRKDGEEGLEGAEVGGVADELPIKVGLVVWRWALAG